uniref:Uncharacterized protein n=1 Tax=Arundo donax TaxID=35708 RepID=A0A0A9L508_ARUDO
MEVLTTRQGLPAVVARCDSDDLQNWTNSESSRRATCYESSGINPELPYLCCALPLNEQS